MGAGDSDSLNRGASVEGDEDVGLEIVQVPSSCARTLELDQELLFGTVDGQ